MAISPPRLSFITGPSGLGVDDERIRARTLSNLRWLGAAGQIVTLGVVYFGLGFRLPIGLCLAAIGASIAMNVLMSRDLAWRWRDRDRTIAISLGFDSLQLAALLYLTGGLENPFSVFFLVPASIAAGALPLRHAISVTVLTFILISLLAFFHWPLPWRVGEALAQPPLLAAGTWVALSIALVFATIYASVVARQREDMHDALAATQMVLAREERLSALGGLAAAAAHELGTPLATIQITAREMLDDIDDIRGSAPNNSTQNNSTQNNSTLREDAALLVVQSVRCRDILSRISLTQNEHDKVHQAMTIAALIDEAAAPLLGFTDSHVSVVFEPPDASDLTGELPRRPEILYGLRNLIENAVKYARTTVTIKAICDDTSVEITVLDDGPGFPPDIVTRLGEPYLGARRHRHRKGTRPQEKTSLTTPMKPTVNQRDEQHDRKGLGLGFFIAKTLLARTGATLRHGNLNQRPLDRGTNARADGWTDRGMAQRALYGGALYGRASQEGAMQGGAFVTVRWPLEQLRRSPPD